MSFTKLKKYIYDTFGGTKKELIDTINGNVFPNDKNMGQAYKRMVQDGYFATRYSDARDDLLELTGISKKQLEKMDDESSFGKLLRNYQFDKSDKDKIRYLKRKNKKR